MSCLLSLEPHTTLLSVPVRDGPHGAADREVLQGQVLRAFTGVHCTGVIN